MFDLNFRTVAAISSLLGLNGTMTARALYLNLSFYCSVLKTLQSLFDSNPKESDSVPNINLKNTLN